MGDLIWVFAGDERTAAEVEEWMLTAKPDLPFLVAMVPAPVPEPVGLKATTDRHPRALATKFLYALRNRFSRLPGGKTWRCWREGYACEWVYPYGWVPEAGCPRHD